MSYVHSLGGTLRTNISWETNNHGPMFLQGRQDCRAITNKVGRAVVDGGDRQIGEV